MFINENFVFKISLQYAWNKCFEIKPLKGVYLTHVSVIVKGFAYLKCTFSDELPGEKLTAIFTDRINK